MPHPPFPPLDLRPGAPLLVAVSGGPDSLALLHVLRELGLPLVCATFDHRLRPESAAETEHVRAMAGQLGVPFVTASADVAAHARAEKLSTEEAARALRYRFLFRAAREAGAQAVATGHTADDQAETVLMHFLRGAGLSGLKGMPPRVLLPVFDAEIPLVRPLLTWTRADTEAYCRTHGLEPVYDPTNADTAYFRNRLRHELLPLLEQYNPQIRQTLAKSALALQGDYQLLADVIETAWRETVTSTGGGFVAFDRAQLASLSPALRRNLLRRAAFALRPGLRDVDFSALERVAALKDGITDLAGGLRLFTEGETVFLAASNADLPSAQWPQLPVGSEQLSVTSGQLELGNGWFLTCGLVEHFTPPATLFADHWSLNTDNWSAWLDADLTGEQLRVRSLRAGERFGPLGMPGASIKLQDFFVNAKLPQRARARWPLVCVNDEIAWIPGYRLAEKFKVTEKTRRVVKLQVKKS